MAKKIKSYGHKIVFVLNGKEITEEEAIEHIKKKQAQKNEERKD